MSQYDTIDQLIIKRLTGEAGMQFTRLYARDVRDEAGRLTPWNGDAFRVLDRRLQALRKRGVIAYNSKTGWALTQPQEPKP